MEVSKLSKHKGGGGKHTDFTLEVIYEDTKASLPDHCSTLSPECPESGYLFKGNVQGTVCDPTTLPSVDMHMHIYVQADLSIQQRNRCIPSPQREIRPSFPVNLT